MHTAAAPTLALAAFLAVAGTYHLVAPAQSEKLFSRVGPVRGVGAILLLLGSWCLFFPEVASYVVGIPTLLSGVARCIFPARMVAVNTWTSRRVHGVLMLMAAAACAWLPAGQR